MKPTSTKTTLSLAGLLFVAMLFLVPQTPVVAAEVPPGSVVAEAFKRLAAKAVAINDTGPIGPKTQGALGIGREGGAFLIYQIKAESGADLHYYNIAKDGTGRVVLFGRIGGSIYYFALDAQLHPIAAATKKNGIIFAVPLDSLRPELMRVMAFWIDWAAKLQTRHPVVQPAP